MHKRYRRQTDGRTDGRATAYSESSRSLKSNENEASMQHADDDLDSSVWFTGNNMTWMITHSVRVHSVLVSERMRFKLASVISPIHFVITILSRYSISLNIHEFTSVHNVRTKFFTKCISNVVPNNLISPQISFKTGLLIKTNNSDVTANLPVLRYSK